MSVAITGYFGSVALPARGFLAWIFAQTTAFQFYNPEFMRGYGTGVLNGSLWTIPVELQFYLLTPVIAWILIRWWRWAVVLLVTALVAANVLGTIALGTVGDAGPSGALLLKLYGVSFLPWLYMFVTGALFARDERVRSWALRIPLWSWVLAYASVCGISVLMGQGLGNRLSPLVFALLALLVFRFAYWHPDLSRRLLGRNDISYGIYIYHMPVINFLIVVGLVGSGFAVLIVVAVTTSLAISSWRFVERPALRLKATSIRPV